MASSGRHTPTSKPVIAKKPNVTRPVSMVNPRPHTPEVAASWTTGRRKSKKKQLSTQSEYSGSVDNLSSPSGPSPSGPSPSGPSTHSTVNERQQNHNNFTPGNNQHMKQRTSHELHSTSDNGVQLSNLIDATKNFPISAIVENGKYGHITEASLYQEKIVIHFEMRLKVIEATLEKGGTFQIPLCTANSFSLLHNPTDNFAQSIMGHYYETVGHILAQPHKPKVVCATRPFSSSTSESSVQEGDILFLSPNVRTKPFKSGRYLKCYNLITNEEKLLHENCIGGFTTQPEHTKMSLKDIWDSKYTHPPMKVIMFHQLPNVVLKKHIQVTLLSEKWEDSVVATKDHTSAPQNESVYGNVQLLRILKDVGISLVADKEENVDHIVYKAYCEETCHLFNEFDYYRIQQHMFNEDPVWPNYEEIQSSLYSHIMRSDWERFVLLKKPENAFKTLKRRKSMKTNSPVAIKKNPEPTKLQIQPGESGNYDVLKPVTREEINDLVGFKIEDQPIPDFASLLHEVNTVNRQMMIQVEGLRAEVEGLKMELKQTKTMMLTVKRDLTSNIGELKSELSIVTANSEDYVPMENINMSPELENIHILKSFTSDQVLQILDKLNLVRCKPVFEQKSITGAELAVYNAQILEKDLGINSHLDIIRLMKIIEGCPVMWKLLVS